MNNALLDETLTRLERYRQAATYGAIAGFVGGSHRTVMTDHLRSQRNSWVVNKRTRRPTGYEPSEYHPELIGSIEARSVIETPEELDEWYSSHP